MAGDELALILRILSESKQARSDITDLRAHVAKETKAIETEGGRDFSAFRKAFDKETRAIKDGAKNFGLKVAQDLGVSAEGAARLAAGARLAATGVAVLGVGVIAAGVGIFKLVESVSEAVDDLADLAGQTNINIETLSALKNLTDDAGGSIETVGQALVFFQRQMFQAQDATSKQGKLFKELSVDTRDNEKAFRDAFRALASMTDGYKQTEAAAQLFGARGGKQVLGLIKESKGDLEAAIERYRTLGTLIGEDAAEAANKFQHELKELQQQIRGVLTEAAIEMMPMITESLNDISQWVRDNKEEIKQTIVGVGQFLNVAVIKPLGVVLTLLQKTVELANWLKSLGPSGGGGATGYYIPTGVLPYDILAIDPNAESGWRKGAGWGQKSKAPQAPGVDFNIPTGGKNNAAQEAYKQALKDMQLLQEKQLEWVEYFTLQSEKQYEQQEIGITKHTENLKAQAGRKLELALYFLKKELEAFEKSGASEKEIEQKREETLNKQNAARRAYDEEAFRLEQDRDKKLEELQQKRLKLLEEVADKKAQIADKESEIAERRANIEDAEIESAVKATNVLFNLQLQYEQNVRDARKRALAEAEEYARKHTILTDQIRAKMIYDRAAADLEEIEANRDEEIRQLNHQERLTLIETKGEEAREQVRAYYRELREQARQRAEDESRERVRQADEETEKVTGEGTGLFDGIKEELNKIPDLSPTEFAANSVAAAFRNMKQAVLDSIDAFIFYGESIGKIMKRAVAQTLAEISKEAAIQGIKQTALALASLAVWDMHGFAMHGASAAAWFAIAGGAALAGRAVMGSMQDKAGVQATQSAQRGVESAKPAETKEVTQERLRDEATIAAGGMGVSEAIRAAIREELAPTLKGLHEVMRQYEPRSAEDVLVAGATALGGRGQRAIGEAFVQEYRSMGRVREVVLGDGVTGG